MATAVTCDLDDDLDCGALNKDLKEAGNNLELRLMMLKNSLN